MEQSAQREPPGIPAAKRTVPPAFVLFSLLAMLIVASRSYVAVQATLLKKAVADPARDEATQLSTMSLPERGALLRRLAEQPLSRSELQKFALNFTCLDQGACQSEDMAEYLTLVFEVAQKQDLLDADLARDLGRLFAGDSFDPNGSGFGKHSRDFFEKCRSMATPEQKRYLEEGIKKSFDDQVARSPLHAPREAVRKLVRAMTNWGDERFAQTADCFFGSQYASSWNLAVKHLGVLFILKAREVSPEAQTLSNQMVRYWLKNLADGKSLTPIKPGQLSSEDRAVLSNTFVEIGRPDVLEMLAERSVRPENIEKGGVINSPPIIYAHQYRNLILKEIRRGFSLDEHQRAGLETELDKNESALTDMLRQFQTEEGTTDGLSGYNTYAVATTVLTSRDPSVAFQAMMAIRNQEYSPYYLDSQVKASPRAGAGRTVAFRLAELAHAQEAHEVSVVRQKLGKSALNFMDYLPDLMFHARGRYWHRGEDQLAPYFFHPTVPYEAAALSLLAMDPGVSQTERAHFKQLKSRLCRDLISSQKADGTFMLPDTVGDPTVKKEENGGYYSSAAWVNPLAGLALLCLIEDAKEPHTRYGILNSESFEGK